MLLHNLRLPKGARKRRKRVGRGNGSGSGKTSTRGMDGQKKRTHPRIKAYFEGGQMPLIRRIPKRGFNNKKFASVFQIVNISELNRFKDNSKISPRLLKKEGLIRYLKKPLKILGSGELKKKLEVSAHSFSKSAQKKIEDSGGKIVILERT